MKSGVCPFIAQRIKVILGAAGYEKAGQLFFVTGLTGKYLDPNCSIIPNKFNAFIIHIGRKETQLKHFRSEIVHPRSFLFPYLIGLYFFHKHSACNIASVFESHAEVHRLHVSQYTVFKYLS